MTTNDRFEHAMSGWLHDDAAGRVTDHLDEVLAVTTTTRQRPAWSSPERWLPVDTTFRPRLFNAPRLSQVLAVAALILALLGALLLYAGSHQQHLPPPFGLARNGEQLSWTNGDIVATDSDGTVHTLVGGPADDLAPLISRDGTRFAFFRTVTRTSFLLMLASIDGSNVHQVLATPLIDSDWFEWSAEDKSIAIVNTAHQRRTLTIVDVDHGTAKDLALGDLSVDNDVYWLPPDGSRLIFTAAPDTGANAPKAIYTVLPDGTGLEAITPIRTDPASYNGLDVSPDGQTASYWNYEQNVAAAGMGSHTHYLDLATKQDRVMTFDATADGETDLRFSPDGQHVVLQREQGTAQLMITTRDGTGPRLRVGPTFSLDQDPAYGFSPDGKSVFLVFYESKPFFFDVATGTETRGPERIENFAGYQRLAP